MHDFALSRRTLLGGAAALLALPSPAAAAGDGIDFDVRVAGSSIGHHRLAFRRHGEVLRVSIDIRMKVRLLFMTVFDYTQRVEEDWEGERLLRLESTTVDGDNHDAVTAVADTEGIAVRSRRFGERLMPADTWPSTAFWRQAAIRRTRFLDAARGDWREVRIEDRGVEQVIAGGQSRAGHRFHVDTSRDFDVWYGANGDWLKLQWSGFGMTADYVRLT
ncbi:MAG: DUF6134 family protein [Pseudomonadota bacterium]|nr:DUF6134 family protein [Pseudomonadota bacterium]